MLYQDTSSNVVWPVVTSLPGRFVRSRVERTLAWIAVLLFLGTGSPMYPREYLLLRGSSRYTLDDIGNLSTLT
jgi:hypothetical protein